MRKLYLSVAILLSIIATAQQKNKTPYTPNIHAPEASNLGKYLDYPVDVSTGVPQIDVPLYEIISGDLKLPITLSYHAAGIKVNQEESNIGLGWNLNAGGSIIRNIKDVPDELGVIGFLTTGNSIPVFNAIENVTGPVGAVGNNDVLKSYYGNINYTPFHKDTQPDAFAVNTNIGMSGEFYINNDLQFVSASFDPTKINANLTDNVIELKDERGNTYRFGKNLQNEEAFDKTIAYNWSVDEAGLGHTMNYFPHSSAWHLTEIISGNTSDIIQLKYKGKTTYQTSNLIENKSFIFDYLSPQANDFKSSHNQTVFEQTIDKIIFKDGYIQFEYAYDRQDRAGSVNDPSNIPRIMGFTVYNNSNEIIKKIVLDNNSYFNRFPSSLLSQWNQQPIPAHHLKSLKLNGIKLLDKNNSLISKYSFDYDSTLLPTKNSGSVDFWGYYNGKSSNTLLPSPLIIGGVAATPDAFTPSAFSYEKREPDFNFMKAGVLTKITYPTGGYSSYEYEPNYFLTSKQEEGLTIANKTFTYYALKSNANCLNDEGQSLVTSPQTIQEFQVTDEIANSAIDFSVFFSDYHPTGANAPKAVIKVDGFQKVIIHEPSGANAIKNESFSFPIHKGSTIRIELYTNNSSSPAMSSPCNSPFISVQGRYNHYVPTTSQNIEPKQAGGLRVKSITSYDNNNLVLLRKSYEYGSKKSGANNKGIGKILSNPYELENYNKSLAFVQLQQGTPCSYTHREQINLNANPMVELGYNNGNPVYYDKVTEYIEDKSNPTNTLGKTEYFYSSQGLDLLPSANYYRPYNTFIYPFWKKGKLLKKIDYKLESNLFSPVYSEEYDYTDIIENKIRTLDIFEQDSEYIDVVCYWGDFLGYIADNPNRFRYFNNYMSVGKRVLNTKTVSQYINNTTEPIKTIFKYQYNNPTYQLTKQQAVQSDNSINETNYSYAYEKGNQLMIDRNMAGIPLETTTTQTIGNVTKTLDRSETIYPTAIPTPQTGNLILPISVKSYDILSNIPSTDITYDKYDEKGNILQYTTKDGISTSIIWGYNSTQPIAKIVGATYDQVAGLASAIISASNDDASDPNNEPALISALNTFRSSLPNYQITTYTYDPLIGVRSITPPSGIREVYKYDSANRLESIKDINGKLLKEFKYNYKN